MRHVKKAVAIARAVAISSMLLGSLLLLAFAPNSVQADPILSNVQVSNVTSSTATITWQTDVQSDTYVSYAAVDGVDSYLASDDSMVTSHQIVLSGLLLGTAYQFEANSADSEGNNTAASGSNFTTLGSGPAPTPTPTPLPTPTPSVIAGPTPTPTMAPSPTPTGTGGLSMPGGLQYQLPAVVAPLYPTGTLAKEGNAIYFLMGKDAVKVPFTSMAVFTGLGYQLGHVQELDLSSFRLPVTYVLDDATKQHPWGAIVSKGGTLYYVHQSGMIGIPSMAVFDANGFRQEMIVPMNAADMAVLAEFPALPALQNGDDRIL